MIDNTHIIINVRGRKFETSKDTFSRIPESRLSKLLSSSLKAEFYFDRNSLFFEYILDVYKTGTLHVPSHMCGGLLKQELQYWGIPLRYIANCCLKNYSLYLDELRIIKEIAKAFATDYEEDVDEAPAAHANSNEQLAKTIDYHFKNESFEEDSIVVPVRSNGSSLSKKPLSGLATLNTHSLDSDSDEMVRANQKSIPEDVEETIDKSIKGTQQRENTKISSDQIVLNVQSENVETQDEKSSLPDAQILVVSGADLSAVNSSNKLKLSDIVSAASTSFSTRSSPLFTSSTSSSMLSPEINAIRNNKTAKSTDIYNKGLYPRGKNARSNGDKRKKSNWKVWQRKFRVFLEDPFSSNLAFIWGCVFLCIVILSVVLQCFSTHPDFRVAIHQTCPETMSTEAHLPTASSPPSTIPQGSDTYPDSTTAVADEDGDNDTGLVYSRSDTPTESQEYKTDAYHEFVSTPASVTLNESQSENVFNTESSQIITQFSSDAQLLNTKQPMRSTSIDSNKAFDNSDDNSSIFTTTISQNTFSTYNCSRMVFDNKNEKEILYLTTVIHPALKIIQKFCVIMFTLELLLRFVLCTNKWLFLKNVYNVVDILALLPTAILELMDLFGGDQFTRENYFKFEFYLGTMGVFKTLRLVKFIRHYRAMKILYLALKASIQEMLLLLLLISIGMLIFSTLIYYTEFYTEDFESIPIGFWWTIVTMTTVGYGDLQPRTGWGYLVGSICAVSGMLSTGLPIPIIANNFNVYYTYAKVHSCKMAIAANDNTKFSKVVKLIGRISTTIKRKPTDPNKVPKVPHNTKNEEEKQ